MSLGPAADPADPRSAFLAGMRAIMPLWLGMVPFALAYAMTARAAGLSLFHTQLMSLWVFAGGAQFSAAGLIAAGAGSWTLVLTTFLINVRHLLYGMSLSARTPTRGWRRWLTAFLLTDEAFGLQVAYGRGRLGFYMGSAVSLYVGWNLTTLVGALLAGLVPDPTAIGLDLIFPLAFLVLLLPLLRGRRAFAVAAVGGVTAWLLGRWLNVGVAILLASVLGALVGAAWDDGEGESARSAGEPAR